MEVILFPYDFYQDPLLSVAVKLSIKDLLPRTKIQPPFCYRHHDLAPHYLSLQMCIGIVFPGIVVAVLVDRIMRGQRFQPRFVIVVKSLFIIVDEDGGCDMHGVYKSESFPDAALCKALLHLGSNVDKSAASGNVKPELFSVTFHMANYLHTSPGDPASNML